ncbi:MAG: hypothetical protein QOG94_441 [Solirubrobacteraceae bacterium]|jgi:hypothetical protein|nr:hypothetical protein [Solirubrobacteraceae bacterium]MEA2137565.1 hypothetical protein [Solirubrobacteraceae bacterium]
MTETITSSHRGTRRLRRRTVAVVAGVAVMVGPLVAAPAAPARSSSLIALLDEMLITGYGGPGHGPVNGLGPLVTAILDALSDLLKPSASATAGRTHARAHLHH